MRNGAGFRGGLSGYYRPEHPVVRETDREPHDLPDEFPAGCHRRGSQRIYHAGDFTEIPTGSSANVSIVKRALVKKELIEIEKRQVIIPDPVMVVWLERELGM